MNQLQVFNFENDNVRALEIDGIPYFVGKDVATTLGYTNPHKAIRDHVDEEDKTVNESFRVNGTNLILLNESGLYSLILSSKMPNAKKFKRWVTSEVLPQIRKTGSYIGFTDEKKIAFETQLISVKYTSEILRVDETSKIKMLEEAHKRYGVPTNHLPQYVDEEVTVSLTTLLRKHGITISTAKINTKLIELGILEIKERPSSKGGVKEFKSLTEKGLYYGKNLINPRCPKETQPHYYESKFSELIRMLIGEAA